MINAEFSFVFFVKYYFTQNMMQIHSKLSQRYEIWGTQNTSETLRRPAGPSLPVGDRSLITTISTHHRVSTFYFELKLLWADLWAGKKTARLCPAPGPRLSRVRIAGSGLITKVVLLLCASETKWKLFIHARVFISSLLAEFEYNWPKIVTL